MKRLILSAIVMLPAASALAQSNGQSTKAQFRAGKLNYLSFERMIEKISFNGNVAIVMGGEEVKPKQKQLNAAIPIMKNTSDKYHALLARSTGLWIGKGTIQFSPDALPVDAGSTILVNSMSMGGLYQVSEFRGTPPSGMGMPWTGLRITGYDTARKVFTRAMIGDGQSAGSVAMEGTWDEASQSITMPFTKKYPSGKEENLKEVYKIIDENTEVLEIYAVDPKTKKEFKMLNVIWTRQQ
ncbi:MAG: DUF1579 family protein [Chitinophagaceae bacterium]|nr:DUF1579 family protein [Chitinophagaceae bacterium]